MEKTIHLKCQKPQCVETPLKTTTLFNFKPKNKGKNLNLSDDTTPANWMWFRRHALLHPSPFTRLQVQQMNFLIYFQEPQIGKDIPSLETQPKRKVSGSGIAPYSTHPITTDWQTPFSHAQAEFNSYPGLNKPRSHSPTERETTYGRG